MPFENQAGGYITDGPFVFLPRRMAAWECFGHPFVKADIARLSVTVREEALPDPGSRWMNHCMSMTAAMACFYRKGWQPDAGVA